MIILNTDRLVKLVLEGYFRQQLGLRNHLFCNCFQLVKSETNSEKKHTLRSAAISHAEGSREHVQSDTFRFFACNSPQEHHFSCIPHETWVQPLIAWGPLCICRADCFTLRTYRGSSVSHAFHTTHRHRRAYHLIRKNWISTSSASSPPMVYPQ